MGFSSANPLPGPAESSAGSSLLGPLLWALFCSGGSSQEEFPSPHSCSILVFPAALRSSHPSCQQLPAFPHAPSAPGQAPGHRCHPPPLHDPPGGTGNSQEGEISQKEILEKEIQQHTTLSLPRAVPPNQPSFGNLGEQG